MNDPELTQKIKSFALENGFDLVGVSGAVLPEAHEKSLLSWIENGHAGGMAYMVRDGGKRAHPEKSLPSARSAISLAVNYYRPEDTRPAEAAGKVARYAYGRDYHKVIEKKLKKLCRFVSDAGGPGTEAKFYVDTGPLLEKAFAQQAGLGFFGKNTNIITKKFGSWVFLASIITNLRLEPDAPHAGSCGSCRLCIEACPTDALIGNYTLDARRCISYLTIESRDAIPEDLRERVGEWVFGCDVCQQVCPYNGRPKETAEPEFLQKRAGTWIGREEVGAMDEEVFARRFQGSPVKRAKLAGMKRNVKVTEKIIC